MGIVLKDSENFSQASKASAKIIKAVFQVSVFVALAQSQVSTNILYCTTTNILSVVFTPSNSLSYILRCFKQTYP